MKFLVVLPLLMSTLASGQFFPAETGLYTPEWITKEDFEIGGTGRAADPIKKFIPTPGCDIMGGTNAFCKPGFNCFFADLPTNNRICDADAVKNCMAYYNTPVAAFLAHCRQMAQWQPDIDLIEIQVKPNILARTVAADPIKPFIPTPGCDIMGGDNAFCKKGLNCFQNTNNICKPDYVKACMRFNHSRTHTLLCHHLAAWRPTADQLDERYVEPVMKHF